MKKSEYKVVKDFIPSQRGVKNKRAALIVNQVYDLERGESFFVPKSDCSPRSLRVYIKEINTSRFYISLHRIKKDKKEIGCQVYRKI